MELHYSRGSPFARIARVFVREYGVQCAETEVVEFPPKPEYFSLNPFGQVPLLVHAGNAYFPTRIVVQFLFSQVRQVPPGLASSVARNDTLIADEQLLAVILAMGDALVAYMYHHWHGLGVVERNAFDYDPAERNLTRVLHTLDWLEERINGGLLGDEISVQDIALACFILWSEARIQISWRKRPKLEALVARLDQRLSFRATAPQPWSA